MAKVLQEFIDANGKGNRGFTFFEGETAASLLARDDLAMWLWTDYGRPVAYGHLQAYPHNPRKAHVGRFGVCVDRENQGNGLGTEVVAYLLQMADQAGLTKVVATVYEDNAPMLRIYLDKAGFHEEGAFVHEELWLDDEYRNVLSLARWL
jgi:RimJ/RimL family protein N-acetyltransferase